MIPIFTPSLETAYLVDKTRFNTYSSSLHPGLQDSKAALARARNFAATQPERHLRLGRTGSDGNFYLREDRDLVTRRHLLGPRSFALISTLSGARRFRDVLQRAGALADYDPPIASPLGNVVNPDALMTIDAPIDPDDLPAHCRAETASTILALPQTFRENAAAIFGVEDLHRVETSLTYVEINWDVPCADPGALIRSYARAVSANLLPRSPATSQRPRRGRPSFPRIYMLSGEARCPRFRFVAYTKLPAEGGRRGVARFEFRFVKRAIKAVLGTTVLPDDQRGVEEAFATLAASAWPTLLALEADRVATRRIVPPHEMLEAVGGLRSQARVREVLDVLAADGKVRVANSNRRIVKRLAERGWVAPLLFRRPAYRKLAPGIDLSMWRRVPGPGGSVEAAPVGALRACRFCGEPLGEGEDGVCRECERDIVQGEE